MQDAGGDRLTFLRDRGTDHDLAQRRVDVDELEFRPDRPEVLDATTSPVQSDEGLTAILGSKRTVPRTLASLSFSRSSLDLMRVSNCSRTTATTIPSASPASNPRATFSAGRGDTGLCGTVAGTIRLTDTGDAFAELPASTASISSAN